MEQLNRRHWLLSMVRKIYINLQLYKHILCCLGEEIEKYDGKIKAKPLQKFLDDKAPPLKKSSKGSSSKKTEEKEKVCCCNIIRFHKPKLL
jgi:hypothetical protein